jgi:hypothetical protein
MTERPLLLMDVDGVLNPFAAPACPEGFAEFDIPGGDGEPTRLCRAHGGWLRELARRYELVWATGWGADANAYLSPLLGLPNLPLVTFPPVPFEPREKVPAIAAYVGERRPVAWVDDALVPEAHAWAAARAAPTLLLGTDPSRGLGRETVERLADWLG